MVCFLDYEMDRQYPEKYRWDVVRMDRELRIPFNETLNEIYLELSECDTIYKKFLYAINNIEIMDHLPLEMNDKLFQKLKSAIELQGQRIFPVDGRRSLTIYSYLCIWT